jgi:hypothetical protein
LNNVLIATPFDKEKMIGFLRGFRKSGPPNEVEDDGKQNNTDAPHGNLLVCLKQKKYNTPNPGPQTQAFIFEAGAERPRFKKS